MNRSTTILVVLFIWVPFALNSYQTLLFNTNTPCSSDEPKVAVSKEIISSLKRKNTMIIATRPASYLRLQAIWSQLECFTSNVDRIILSVPDEAWCHRTMENFTSQVEKSNLPSSLYDKITVQYYKNDRYDSGLWCDSLEEENAGVSDDGHNYLLINDSILAIRQYDGLLNALLEDGVSFVSLNYWLQMQEGGQPYWLESAARAFTSRGIKKYRAGVCQNLAEEVGTKCSKMVIPKKRKRCVVDYTEIPVAAFYNSSETRGLYPGEVHPSMVHGRAMWSGNIPFWKNVLVDQMNFPAAKVSHGFIELIPEMEVRHKYLYSCMQGLPPDQRMLKTDQDLIGAHSRMM